jgi:hypothetical protein
MTKSARHNEKLRLDPHLLTRALRGCVFRRLREYAQQQQTNENENETNEHHRNPSINATR